MPTTPTIPQGSQYMQADIYNGNSGTTDTLYDFNPGMVWYKCRSNGATYHYIFDTVRGANNAIYPNLTSAENAEFPTYNTQSFVTNGSRIVYNGGDHLNASGRTYVNWAWKAGSTVTNTSGSITSQVSANTTSGFSVVTWTGNGNNSLVTIGHGLGVTPAMVIVKPRSAVVDWAVAHQSLGNARLYLNLTSASYTGFGGGGDIGYQNSYTSTTINVQQGSSSNNNYNGSGETLVAYCWAPIAGYSAFGSYTGNGSADGPFVYLGFRPRFVMIKISSTTGSWYILDTSVNSYNEARQSLQANSSAAEVTDTNFLDILSNGFKLRTNGGAVNGSGATIIYAAFAENPFKFSNAR